MIDSLMTYQRTWRGFEMMWDAMDKTQRHKFRSGLNDVMKPFKAELNETNMLYRKAADDRIEARKERDEMRQECREALDMLGRRLAECDAYQARGIQLERDIESAENERDEALMLLGAKTLLDARAKLARELLPNEEAPSGT